MNIAFRLDVGENIGYGHFTRCYALARELNNNSDINVFFIVRNKIELNDNYHLIQLTTQYKDNISEKYIYANIDDELEEMIRIIKENSIYYLIVDNYGVSKRYFSLLRNYLKYMIYIDDLHKEDYDVDMTINGNCYATELEYNTNKLNLLGCQYTLLRQEFKHCCKNRIINKKVRTITITTGGSDPLDMTSKIIDILNSCVISNEVTIRIIIGSAFSNVEKIQNKISNSNNFLLVFNADMKKEMIKSDLFITSSGSTLYELAVTGTPSISFVLSHDQELVAEYMNKLGTTFNLGYYTKIEKRLEKEINVVINSYAIRYKMSINGINLIDGLGAKRTAKAILENIKR